MWQIQIYIRYYELDKEGDLIHHDDWQPFHCHEMDEEIERDFVKSRKDAMDTLLNLIQATNPNQVFRVVKVENSNA